MAKYLLTGDARDIPLAASMLLAQEQLFLQYMGQMGGGSTSSRELAPKRKGKLKVRLFFWEPSAEIDPEFSPVSGEISFRLMNDDPTTISLNRLQAIATKIVEKFKNFTWRKGKAMCSYSDWDRGYQLQILAIDGAEGKRVADQVLEIQGHTFEGEFFNVNTNWSPTTRYPVLPEKSLVAGTPVRENRQRPIANVKFSSADVFFPRIGKPYPLVYENMEILKELKIAAKTG